MGNIQFIVSGYFVISEFDIKRVDCKLYLRCIQRITLSSDNFSTLISDQRN